LISSGLLFFTHRDIHWNRVFGGAERMDPVDGKLRTENHPAIALD
jgi:hypothetical protein